MREESAKTRDTRPRQTRRQELRYDKHGRITEAKCAGVGSLRIGYDPAGEIRVAKGGKDSRRVSLQMMMLVNRLQDAVTEVQRATRF